MEKKVGKHIHDNENINVRQYIEKIKIDEQRSTSSTILKWIYSVKEVIKKVKQLPRNGIRRYFEI